MNRKNHEILKYLLILLISCIQLTASAQKVSTPLVQPFTTVFYAYPLQVFADGWKYGVDFNMKNRYVLGFQVSKAFSLNPKFHSQPGNSDGSGIDVLITPNYISENNLKFLFKNYIGGYANTFHGTYLGAFYEHGFGSESYYTQLARNFPQTYVWNAYRHQRVGMMLGKHWTVFNAGVVDVNIGVGYNRMLKNTEVIMPRVAPFAVPQNSAYFVSNIGFGLGKRENLVQLPRKPRLSDSLELHYAVTVDLNAAFHSGMEMNLYGLNRKKSLMRFFVRVRNSSSSIINVTSADSFSSVSFGAQYRYYPYASTFRSGIYLGTGYQYEHAKNTFANRENQAWAGGTYLYDIHAMDFTMGVTTIIGYRYIIDTYVSNVLTLSKPVNSAPYGRLSEASGLRTVVGIKFGMARFRRK